MSKTNLIIDISNMTEEQIHEKLLQGYKDAKSGRTQNAAEAFRKFKATHFNQLMTSAQDSRLED